MKLYTIIFIIFACLFTQVVAGSVGSVTLHPYGSQDAYITNSGSNNVVVLNTSTYLTDAIISVGNAPIGCALNNPGTFAYVTNQGSNTVSVINTTSNTVTATVHVGSNPQYSCVSPDNLRVYVSNTGGNTVTVINAVNNTIVGNITVGNSPLGSDITPNGRFLYVCNSNGNSISVVDTLINTVVTTIPITNPQEIIICENGTLACVTELIKSGVVATIDLSTNTITDSIRVGTHPFGESISPDNNESYITNTNDGTVSIVNLVDHSLKTTVNVGVNPVSIGIAPNGNNVFVINQGDNSISVINTTTDIVTNTIHGFNSTTSYGIFVRPSTIPIATIYGVPLSGDSPLTIQFHDDFYGVPLTWLWNWGDGTVDSNIVNPIHTYTHTGLYTVTLTVSNAAGYSVNTAYQYVNVTGNNTTFTPSNQNTISEFINMLSSTIQLLSLFIFLLFIYLIYLFSKNMVSTKQFMIFMAVFVTYAMIVFITVFVANILFN